MILKEIMSEGDISEKWALFEKLQLRDDNESISYSPVARVLARIRSGTALEIMGACGLLFVLRGIGDIYEASGLGITPAMIGEEIFCGQIMGGLGRELGYRANRVGILGNFDTIPR